MAVRRAQSLAELGRIIGTLNVLEEDFDTLANELSNLIKFDRFALVTSSSDDNKKETKFTSGVSIPEVNDVEAALWIEPQSDQPKKFGEGTITITRSIQEFQQAFPTLDGSQFAGLASRLCVPIVQKNSTVGRLIFRSYDPGAYSRHDLDLGQSIAHSIAGAIASYQHYVMLKEETAERLALARISQIISSSLDIDEIYEKFVEEVHKLIPFDRIVISLIDVENQTVQDTYIAGLQVPNRRSDDIYPLSGSFADLALNKGSVLLIQKAEDLEDIDNGVFMFMPCYESGIRSFLTVSLILNDRVIGALHLRSLQPEAYTRKDVALAESVGAQIAGAIAGSKIYSELRIAEQALQDAQEQLEQRVKDRTVKLSKANNLLQQEITERKQMEDNLLKAAAKINAQASELTITNARLTKANQAKAELLAHVSHELQTPLNAALGFARLLTEPAFGTLAPRQQHFVDNILEAGHDLLHLINDIIDASRIESGRMQLDISDVDVGGWVSSCIRILNERAAEKGLNLNAEYPEEGFTIRGDERRLKQVLFNLLDNAVKFTPQGGQIDLRTAVVENELQVSVTDTGIGIKPEFQKDIFHSFEQESLEIAKKYGGSGLGLSLVRNLTEMHGGRVWVKSVKGKGSTFAIALPLEWASV